MRLSELEGEYLITAIAYQMRLVLQGVYECRRESTARRKFQECQWVPEKAAREGYELLQPMARVAGMRSIGKEFSGTGKKG